MKLPILNTSNSNDIEQFIEFWSKLYHYPKDHLYRESIFKNAFETDDLKKLFEWKNGMPLEGSGIKEKSLNQNILAKDKITKINSFKNQSQIDLSDFLIEFEKLSAVWKIFLLHIIKPLEYPIYDQNIHRAFYFIHSRDWDVINEKMSNKKKEEFYFTEYLQFIKSLKYNNYKKIDEAFFAFGQFLNIKKQQNLLL